MISALSTFETGQFFSAARASSSNLARSIPGTLALRVRADLVIVNKSAFDGLDQATKDAVLKAAKTAEDRGWKVSHEKTKWYTDQLASKGMKVLPPGPDLKTGLQKVGEQLTQDWLKKAGSDGQAIVDAYKKAGT